MRGACDIFDIRDIRNRDICELRTVCRSQGNCKLIDFGSAKDLANPQADPSRASQALQRATISQVKGAGTHNFKTVMQDNGSQKFCGSNLPGMPTHADMFVAVKNPRTMWEHLTSWLQRHLVKLMFCGLLRKSGGQESMLGFPVGHMVFGLLGNLAALKGWIH